MRLSNRITKENRRVDVENALHWFKWMFSILIHCQHPMSVRRLNLLFSSRSALNFVSPHYRKKANKTLLLTWAWVYFLLRPLRFIAVSFQFFDAIFVIILIVSHLAFVVIKFNQSTHSTVSCANMKHSSSIPQGNRLFQTQTRTVQHINFISNQLAMENNQKVCSATSLRALKVTAKYLSNENKIFALIEYGALNFPGSGLSRWISRSFCWFF